MTILPKKNKTSTATCSNNSTSTTKNAPSGPSASSSASDSGGNSPLANSDARKRPCTDRASNENMAHSSTSSDSNPGPSSSKRRHTTSTSSERRHHHHHHLLHLHHSNLTATSKASSATHQASPVQLTNYPEASLEVQEASNKVASSTHSCCPSTCETSQASSSGAPSTGNSGMAIDTLIVTSEASNNQMPPPPASPTGYNSGDEYGSRSNCNAHHCTPEQLSERERRFEKKLRKKGLSIMKMGEDGSCLFRAVADQVYGDEEMHSLVRKLCCDYMIKNSDYFSQYVTEDFTEYVSRKRRDHIQGNHVELQALSELFARPIEVYHYNSEPMNIFQAGQDDEDQLVLSNSDPIRVSYHTHAMSDSGHYNSVRPIRGKFKAQAALIYTPPQVLESAIRNSEADVLEKAMLEDKLRATDWEATNEALEEQVARESYLEWLRENERRRQRSGSNGPNSGGRHSPLTTSSSTITNSSEPGSGSPKAGGSRSPNAYSSETNATCRQSWQPFESSHLITCTDTTSSSSKSHQNSPVLPYYLEELPEGPEAEREILARVLLASRQEYLQSLKNCKKSLSTSMPCNRDSSSPSKSADAL